MAKRLLLLLLCMPALSCVAQGEEQTPPVPEPVVTPAPVEENSAPEVADGGQRVVAIGDIHGDYDQFVKLLRSIGLIDMRNVWVGGDTHLVQLGDIPDRGPDSRKVMDLLMTLEKSAPEAGGAVTVLIGNHEAMMMTNDLRYVHPGEYKAFKTSKSKALRSAYYKQTIKHLTANSAPDEVPVFDRAYRKSWEKRFPLGYVEHRQAWAPTGEYGAWVLSRDAVAKIGGTLFVHGGLSPEMSGMSLVEINTRVRTALAEGVGVDTIVDDEFGPLWYRGWASSAEDNESQLALDKVLANYDAKRMVIGHTPLAPAILPRFNGKLLLADVGLSAHYGHGFAAVELQGDQVTALINEKRIAVPESGEQLDDYFAAVAEVLPGNAKLERYLRITGQAANDPVKNPADKQSGKAN